MNMNLYISPNTAQAAGSAAVELALAATFEIKRRIFRDGVTVDRGFVCELYGHAGEFLKYA